MNSECKVSLQDLLSMYFKYKELRLQTQNSYRNIVRVFEKFFNKKMYLDDISVENILHFRNHILHDKLRSHQTWNTYNRHFSSLLNFAIEHSLTKRPNPFYKMKVKIIAKKKKTLDLDKMDKAILYLQDKAWLQRVRDYYYPVEFWITVIKTFRYTGIRLNQLLHVRLCDLKENEKILFLRGIGSKTHTEREIPIIDELCDELTTLKKILINKGANSNDQLFNIYRFKPSESSRTEMDATRINIFFQQLSKQLSFPISPHRFRHTLATQLMKDPDRNLHLVKELLGHSSINTTLEYVETDIEQLKKCLISYSRFR